MPVTIEEIDTVVTPESGGAPAPAEQSPGQGAGPAALAEQIRRELALLAARAQRRHAD
jgi:hypothetical protein